MVTAKAACLRYYTVVFKLQVVERTMNREASRKFGVDEKRVRDSV